MQPLGILGALLGGYQQGRTLKQNRELRAAQVARQLQENADLKKYRADSLELQRRRLEQAEDPYEKAQRDLFLTSLKGLGDDVDNAFDDLERTKTDADSYNAGAEAIYNRYNDRYQRLRYQHGQSPSLLKLGDFDTISGYNVPNFVRAPKYDSSLIRRRAFDSSKFIKDTNDFISKNITGAGIEDPAVQRSLLDNWFDGQAKIHGKNVQDLWQMSGIVQPNEIERGTTLGVRESGFIPTTKTDPSFPAFGTKTVNDNGNNVTYQHSLPENIATLPELQKYLQSKNGIGPQVANAQAPVPQGPGPSSDQMADEFIVDDLHRMFTTPSIAAKYGLTDPNNKDQFRQALQIYMSPQGHQDIQLELDRGVFYGNNGNGYLPNYPYGNPGNFGTSAKGQGLQGMIQNAPLMASSTTLEPVPYERRTGIPLSLKDRAAVANIRNIEARTKGQNFTNDILDAKGRVAQATVYDQIRSADLKTLSTGMRLALEPLKFDLKLKQFDLDTWDKEFDNNINAGRLGVQKIKTMIIDASTASRALLATAQKDLTSASMTLGSFLRDNMTASAVFKKDPVLKGKIDRNEQLTPEDLAKIDSDVGLTTDRNVKEALQRYKEAQSKYKQSYAAVLAYANLATTINNSSAFNMGVEPSTGADNPFNGLGLEGIGGGNSGASNNQRPTSGGGVTAPVGAGTSNNAGANVGGGSAKATPAPAPTSTKPTNTTVIETARQKFARKVSKPKTNTNKNTGGAGGNGKPGPKASSNPFDGMTLERK